MEMAGSDRFLVVSPDVTTGGKDRSTVMGLGRPCDEDFTERAAGVGIVSKSALSSSGSITEEVERNEGAEGRRRTLAGWLVDEGRRTRAELRARVSTGRRTPGGSTGEIGRIPRVLFDLERCKSNEWSRSQGSTSGSESTGRLESGEPLHRRSVIFGESRLN
eukprot:gene13007-27446_t